MSNNNPKSRQNDLVMQELPDEVLIYDLKTNKAFCLNHTAAFVWQHADGSTPISQIAYLLQKKLRAKVDESIVWFALESLQKDGLMENRVEMPPMFAGMSRRQLILTIGKSAAVALPLVMMIIAPMPAAAGSGTCRQIGETCTPGNNGVGNCCSGGLCLNTGLFGSGINQCCAQASGACSVNSDCCQFLGPATCSSGICSVSGVGCLLYDTPIITADGSTVKAIDVFVGQSLLGINCINGEKVAGRVKAVQKLSAEGFYSLTAESGDVVQCSPSHPLINGYGDKWGKKADQFREGDSLLVFDNKSNRIVEAKTTAVEYINVPQPVIIFEMDTMEHTFVSGGIVSHNRALK